LSLQYQQLQCLAQRGATRVLLYDPRNDPAPLGDQHIIALFDQSDVPAQLVFQFLDACRNHVFDPDTVATFLLM